jgi:hypothetical protein
MLHVDPVTKDYVGQHVRVSAASFCEAREALVVSGVLDVARAELLLLDERLWRHDQRAQPIEDSADTHDAR